MTPQQLLEEMWNLQMQRDADGIMALVWQYHKLQYQLSVTDLQLYMAIAIWASRITKLRQMYPDAAEKQSEG